MDGTSVGSVSGFHPAVREYAFEVAHDVETVTVSARGGGLRVRSTIRPADADAAVPGRQVALAAGATTTVTVVVTADGEETTYTLRIARPAAGADASLRSLALAGLDLGVFHGTRTEYRATAARGRPVTTVVAYASNAAATVTVEPADTDATVDGHQVRLAADAETAVTVRVRSADGSASRTYRVRVAAAAETAAPLPDELNRAVVLGHLRRHGIDTVEAFVAALPATYRRNFMLVYESEALFAERVSHEAPRVISWGANADMVLAWTTGAEPGTAQSVEFLEALDDRWAAGIVDFSGATPQIREPAVCGTCHGPLAKPLWGQLDHWKGTEAEGRNFAVVGPARRATGRAARSDDARLAPLDFLPSVAQAVGGPGGLRIIDDGLREYQAPWEMMNVLLTRHERVLFNRLRKRDDYGDMARELICGRMGSEEAVTRHFAAGDHHLAVRADTGEFIQGNQLLGGSKVFAGAYAGDARTLKFFVLRDLAARDGAVAEALGSGTGSYGGRVSDTATIIESVYDTFAAFPSAKLMGLRARSWSINSYPHALHMGLFLRNGLDAYRKTCRVLDRAAELAAPSEGSVVGFAVIDAAGTPIAAIPDGAALDKQTLGSRDFRVRAEVAGGEHIDSLELELMASGSDLRRRVALGTQPFEADFGTPLGADDYYLSATPYPEAGLSGGSVRPLSVRFSVLRAGTLAAAGNDDPFGAWSDGETLYVLDGTDRRAYAYDLGTGVRRAGRDVALAGANGAPRGLWSNGATLWVADAEDDRLYAYELANSAPGGRTRRWRWRPATPTPAACGRTGNGSGWRTQPTARCSPTT